MAISQISTSNTFAQWLTATQILIEKENYFEDRTNLVFEEANTVSNAYNVIVNTEILLLNTANNINGVANLVYSTSNNVANIANDVSAKSNSVNNTSNIIFSYVGTSFNVANAVFVHANSAFDRANGSFNRANGAFLHANSAFDTTNAAYSRANSAFNHSNGAFDLANSTFITISSTLETNNTVVNLTIAIAETANYAANLVNTVQQNVFTIIDDNSNTDTFYLTFVPTTSGIPNDVYVSSTKLYYVPSTGQISATNFNSLSDVNKKNNIITLENALESVMNLRGVSFTWKDSHEKAIGVIAQEIEQVVPEVVSTNEHGEKSVSYGNIVGLLIQAIKELKKEINDLKDIINKTK